VNALNVAHNLVFVVVVVILLAKRSLAEVSVKRSRYITLN